MYNLYPLFERNRILKKELLWSLRDYSFAHIQVEYQEYGQGVLQGCRVEVQGGELVIHPGIVKYVQFICLITEEERISYVPMDHWQFLKIRIEKEDSSPDYIAYKIEILLDTNQVQNENEFELCRFYLKPGAQLRDQYTSFQDLGTEYDTVNQIHAAWGGVGGSALAPAITRSFACAILESKNSTAEDCSFAYFCLSLPGAVPAYVLDNYIRRKAGGRAEMAAGGSERGCVDRQLGNGELYQAMCAIIGELGQKNASHMKTTKERRRIIVD